MTQQDFQREAEQTRYALRSSFFYRVHSQWTSLLALAEQQANRPGLDWTQPQDLGISDAAWRRVESDGVVQTLVFCHPEVIRQTPALITYYRCLALLPQKGLQRLAGYSTKALEEGKASNLSRSRAQGISSVLNSLISLLIDSDPNWTLENARVAALLNLGTQINGSWRNEIGSEGSRRVKELLVGSFIESRLVENVIGPDGSHVPYSEAAPSSENIRGLDTVNGYTIRFGSEPDVSIRDGH